MYQSPLSNSLKITFVIVSSNLQEEQATNSIIVAGDTSGNLATNSTGGSGGFVCRYTLKYTLYLPSKVTSGSSYRAFYT